MDEQDVVKGIVSLSDILQALVLTDGEEGKHHWIVEFWSLLILEVSQYISGNKVQIVYTQALHEEESQTKKGCTFLEGGKSIGTNRHTKRGNKTVN